MPLNRAALLAMLFLSAVAASAQSRDSTTPTRTAGGELPPFVKAVLRPVLASFTRPVHPIIGGAAPGSGIGLGLGVSSPWDSRWKFGAKGVVTQRRYWTTETDAEYRGESVNVLAYGRLRDMPQLGFYGLGSETAVEARTTFAMREGVVGTVASARVAPWVVLGARVEENWAKLGPGRSTQYPSIETQFSANDVPGLTDRAKYARYEASVNLRVPAALGEAFYQGARYRIAYAYYDDQRTDLFSFTRLDLEAQQRFAIPATRHILTLHGWVSTARARAGQDTPFYLQRTLGGKSFVRSVRDDLIGSDGSDATLRGYSELRFRERNLLLLQAEYRIPIWALFDATLFADAGKVAHDRSGLDLKDLRHNIGFSLAAMKGDRTMGRVDVAFGGEGTRMLLTIGRDLTR